MRVSKDMRLQSVKGDGSIVRVSKDVRIQKVNGDM